MTKQDIFSILDKNVAVGRSSLKIVGWVGVAFIAGGIAFLLFLTHDAVAVASIFGGLGLVLALIGFVSLARNSVEKRAERIKHLLNYEPKNLIWAYVLRQNNRGAISISVVINFRSGETYNIADNAIPGKDTEALLRTLTLINPDMHLGYSEELQYKFKKKTL